MQIAYRQLDELISELSNIYQDVEEEFIKKLYFMEYDEVLTDINIIYSSTVTPSDTTKEFELDSQKLAAQAISQDQFNARWGRD